MLIDWIEPIDINVPHAIQAAVGGHALVAQTLIRRGFSDMASIQAFLNPQPSTNPEELPGMAIAADRLLHAIQKGERICVWGDFDVDGQTATTVLVSALRDLGGVVDYHIPVREVESHGVNLAGLQEVLGRGARLVLTCDTGIAAHEAAAYASQQGVDFIVTDHHELPEELPHALALVNPRCLPDSHPLSALPGVGVAYKLVELLYLRSNRPEACTNYLDLVALGIVADVALLVGETRSLLQKGLKVLRATTRLGLQVLMEQASINPAWISEEHIGFVLGPRMNALGRLANANVIVEFLTTQDASRARVIALQLEGYNEKRKRVGAIRG
jgi:single-stranded-DNA-specific exonuclease